MKNLSVIIPIYNEIDNLGQLINRLVDVLESFCNRYELIFIDDHSSDGSFGFLQSASIRNSNIRIYLKEGKKGKAYSLLEGIERALFDVIGMIDGDLQYPPEAIKEMFSKIYNQEAEIVIANRTYRQTTKSRTFLSRVFKSIFGHFVFGINHDIQSGLKVFSKKVFYNLQLSPTKWGFDYEFVYKAVRMKWRVSSVDIDFPERKFGESKVRPFQTALELFSGALVLRTRYLARSFFKFIDYPHHSERSPYNFSNEHDFLFLPEIHSAKRHIYAESVSFFLLTLTVAIGFFYVVSNLTGIPAFVILSALIAAFYLLFMLFKVFIVYLAIRYNPEIKISDEEALAIPEGELPIYTILIPLYREEGVINQISAAMGSINYPTDKLDITITLEEYDHPTINAISEAGLPSHFKTLILPDVKPKTKPKALNVAFLQVSGEFLVIYDAEIIPEPLQLRRAFLAFKKNQDIACLQTKLDHYNPKQSLVTRLFNSEFSFHYDYFMPGLQKLGVPLPLSGHSTHFRTEMISQIGAWDPYNVTEDCDMGIRLARIGQKTGILDSTSQEEATADFKSWVLQRTRWMKGFIQTSIVHMRHPFRFTKEIGGLKNLLGFLLIVPGSVLINVINFIYWIVFLVWIFFQPAFIQELFPRPILYISVFSFVLGNFIFTYLNLLATYKRGRYDLVKYNLLSFIYWIMLAVATTRAVIEIFIKPHHWEKTVHGTHLANGRTFAFRKFFRMKQ